MSPLSEPLLAVLREQTAVCCLLVQTLQEDRARVVRNRVEALEESNQRKEGLVLQLQQLEFARQRETQQLAEKLGVPLAEARISTLAERLGPEAAALQAAAESLRAVVASLKELLAVSYGFLEQSILGIRSVLGLIASLRGGDSQVYDSSGRIAEPSGERASVRSEV